MGRNDKIDRENELIDREAGLAAVEQAVRIAIEWGATESHVREAVDHALVTPNVRTQKARENGNGAHP